MAYTWDQISNLNLTAAQKNKLAQAEAIGLALQTQSSPDISTVAPADAKKILNFYRELERIRLAYEAAKHIMRRVRQSAAQNADTAVPDAPL